MNLNIKSSALWALAEIVVSALLVFLAYRLIVKQLGASSIGVWSIVLASTSLVRIADPGVNTGLGRFVSIAYGHRQPQEAADYFMMALTTTGVFYIILAGLAYWPLVASLPLAVSGENLSVARELVPYAIASFVLMNINGAVQGAVSGLQRSDVKSKIVIATSFMQLAIVVAFLPTKGLKALAMAQIAQYAVGVTVGYLWFLRALFDRTTLFPGTRWDAGRCAQLWTFGFKLQAVSMLSFFYDPLGKFMISHISGVETLGIFEMAQKYIIQVRQVIVGPTSILMPAFSHLHESARHEVASLYLRALSASTVIGASLMALAALSSPLVSFLWLGRIEPTFVIFAAVMAIAWFASIIAAPSYLHSVAIGSLKWNIYGALVTLALTPVLSLTIGRALGPVSVASSVVISLAIGTAFTMAKNCRSSGLPFWPSMENMTAFVKTDLMRLIPSPLKRWAPFGPTQR